MSLIRRKRVLAAKIETTVGTAIALSASDAALNVYNAIIQPTIAMEQREGQGGFNYLSAVPGTRTGVATFRTDISYDGTNIPSWASTFLPACGWVDTAGVFNPVTSAPGSNGVKTLTIGVYNDGKVKKISGAMGSFTITAPTGRLAYIDWTFTGKYEDEADVAILAPTYPTTLPSRAAGGTFDFNSVALCAETVTIESGNTISPIECVTSDTGYDYFFVGDRKPMVKANPLAVLVATIDRYGLWTGATEYALDLTLPGADGTVSFTAPKAQIQNMQEGDRNGIVSDDIEWSCNKNGSTHDQELSITFTAAV